MTWAQVMCLCLVCFGLGVVVQFWAANRYVRSLRTHVRLLKGQAHAAERLILTAEDMAEQWRHVAQLNGAREEEERHRREVAERRLSLVRDNMHRERES